ncbi:hypothetical protein GGX14DRAFT_441594 [Mycena pura]|uniref:Uncharacterized protein n=1 Tax=Mycena pura TaxID=153505 RepID=A0AAD6VLI5_9AGAR|nr:hypothetical protein GGX14DRAFT_441594 [Mycena pura]
MAASYPLAALTLLTITSLCAPVPKILFRSIRRITQATVIPAADTQLTHRHDSTAATKPGNSIYSLFLKTYRFIFASLHGKRPATLLPVAQIHDALAVRNIHVSVANEDTQKDRVGESPLISPAVPSEAEINSEASTDAPAIRNSPTCPPPPVQHSAPSHGVCVDFTIGWDDIWPESQAAQHMKYMFCSTWNAYVVCVSLDSSCHWSTSSSLIDVPFHDDSGSNSDSEIDAFELVSRSADEDILQALHALSTHDSAPRHLSPSSPIPLPPAGLSPFCPPPHPTPNPPSPVTTWRLEWY